MDASFIIDLASGALVVEGLSAREWRALAGDLLPGPTPINCGRPAVAAQSVSIDRRGLTGGPTLRVARIYHGSVVEGPGRRSVVQLQGCSIRCPGCYLRELWPAEGGVEMSVDDVVSALLDPAGEPRDGVTILGGEPFDQSRGLAALGLALAGPSQQHITLYTGYTIEALLDRDEIAVGIILALTDLLIDGPYLRDQAEGAGEWRGSQNQRVIYDPWGWSSRGSEE